MSADQLHIDATRKQDPNAIVEVSWTDLSNVFGLDPGEPEDLRAIYDCAEEGGDLMIPPARRTVSVSGGAGRFVAEVHVATRGAPCPPMRSTIVARELR